MAKIDNSLGQIGGSGGGSISQNNIFRRFHLIITKDDMSNQDVVDAINALDEFIITEIQLPLFIVLNINSSNIPVNYSKYIFTEIGKGIYGSTGTQITTENIEMIEVSQLMVEDFFEFEDTQQIDFGNIGSLSIEDYIKTLEPSIEINDPSVSYTIITAIIDGITYTYLFTGVGGTYGLNDDVPSYSDFEVLNSTSSILQNLQSVTQVGNTTTYPIFVQGAKIHATPFDSIYVGLQAGQSATGSFTAGLGYQAGYNNTGAYVVGVGTQTASFNTGSYVTAIGRRGAGGNPYNNTIHLSAAVNGTLATSNHQLVISTNDKYLRINTNIPNNVLFTPPTVGGVWAMSVNGNLADSTGNITIATGGGGDFIPLSGTTVGNPVTGPIELSGDASIFTDNGAGKNVYMDFVAAVPLWSVAADDGVNNMTLNVNPTEVGINTLNPTSRGIVGVQDFSANLDDYSYTQKIYVDAAIIASTQGLEDVIAINNTVDGDTYQAIFQGALDNLSINATGIDLYHSATAQGNVIYPHSIQLRDGSTSYIEVNTTTSGDPALSINRVDFVSSSNQELRGNADATGTAIFRYPVTIDGDEKVLATEEYVDDAIAGIGTSGVSSVTGATNRITSTGGTTPVIDISSTFEALLSKKASRIDQNNASTTSAQLATVISDETGTGSVVFNNTPSLITPTLISPVLTGVSSPGYVQGKLAYDTDNECLTFFNNDSNVNLQIGQEQWIRVRNTSGSTIPNGSAVYINGSSSGLPTVTLAQADNGSTTVVAGLTTEAIPNNTIGYVTSLGVVNDLNTSSFSVGPVYLSATTPGALTQTVPSAPNYRYRIGFVTNVNSTTGKIHVTPSTAVLGTGTSTQVLTVNSSGSQEWQSGFGKAVAKSSADSSAVTGTTSEAILVSIPITANEFASGNLMRIFWSVQKTGIAGTSTIRLRVNTTSSLSGATQIAIGAAQNATNLGYAFERHLNFRPSNVLEFTGSAAPVNFENGTSSIARSSMTLDPTVTFYLLITAQLASSADSIINSTYLVERL